MRDPVGEWQQQGSIYLWRFKPEKRGLTGWHFAGDDQGCASTVALVRLLIHLDYPAKRTLRLAPPSCKIARIPFAYEGAHRLVCPTALRLRSCHDQLPSAWGVTEDADHVEFALGREALKELLAGIESLRQGDWDFSVGPHEGGRAQNVWMWSAVA